MSIQAQMINQDITVQQADSLIKVEADNTDFVLLDIRTLAEYNKGHLKNSKMINYLSRRERTEFWKLDKQKSYLIYCRSGVRSAALLKKMKKRHFEEVYNMLGGIRDWMKEEYPIITDNQ